MSNIIAARLKKYLDRYKIRGHLESHAPTVTLTEAQSLCGVPAEQFARSVLLKCGHELFLAILPLSHQLDFSKLERRLKRPCHILLRQHADKRFYDCEPGSHPPFGEPYGLKMIIDPSLLKAKHVYFEPGSHRSLMKMSKEDFRFLNTGALWRDIAQPIEQDEAQTSRWEKSRNLLDELVMIHNPCFDQICHKVHATYKIPSCPKVAQDLLALLDRGSLGPSELIDCLSQEKGLAQEVCEQWNQVFPGQPVNQLHGLIRELGIQKVTCLSLVFSIMRMFQVQQLGPLGAKAIWQHALLSAEVAYRLVEALPATKSLCAEKVYLGALAHNVGFMLFGHLFKPEYCLLNKMFIMHRKSPIELLEKKILGMGQAQKIIGYGHASMGAWLLTQWHFPEEIIACAAHHHKREDESPFKPYIDVLKIANDALRKRDVGEGEYGYVMEPLLKSFSLQASQIEVIIQDCLNSSTLGDHLLDDAVSNH